MDNKTFQLFISDAALTFGYIQSLSFALNRAVTKVFVGDFVNLLQPATHGLS